VVFEDGRIFLEEITWWSREVSNQEYFPRLKYFGAVGSQWEFLGTLMYIEIYVYTEAT